MLSRRTLGQSVLGLLAGGAAMALSGCGVFGGNSYRFKMTVEVDTPQGVKSGSSVYEVHAATRLALTSEEAEISDGLNGQATIVDLPNGPIFVLLKSPPGAPYLHRAVTEALSGRPFDDLDDLVAMTGKLGGLFSGTATAELPREDWPMMVRFRDLNDPTSVERVDPASVGVKRILLETTSDDMTTGIEERIRWIGTNPKFSDKFEKNRWLTEKEIGVAEQIGPRDFSTEFGR